MNEIVNKFLLAGDNLCLTSIQNNPTGFTYSTCKILNLIRLKSNILHIASHIMKIRIDSNDDLPLQKKYA